MVFTAFSRVFIARCRPQTLISRANYLSTKRLNINSSPSLLILFNNRSHISQGNHYCSNVKMSEFNKEDLKKKLTHMQYHVTQEKGTERPFTGEYDKFFDEGVYSCVVCGQQLFSSKTKFDSGCGWPAFNDVLDQGLVKLSKDTSLAPRIRTEVQCSKCDAHMGHVFDDGPKPTGKRFCINSASIVFTTKTE